MSSQKRHDEETRVPLSVVFMTIGVILILAVGTIWLLVPNTMPRSVYAAITPLLPETITLPTPAAAAQLPVLPTATPQPEAIPLLPETPPEETAANEDNIVSMADALKQKPVKGEPVRLVIPEIDLDAPIVDIGVEPIEQNGQTYYQWLVPDSFAAGWHNNSARLGEVGNTVLNGHHNVYDEVFRDLVDLEEGDKIIMYDSEDQVHTYLVTVKEILPERGQPIEVRLENAQWIAPTEDERVTLVTCWPYTDNSHRLIVVAEPVEAASTD